VFRTDDPDEGRLLLNARRMAVPALEAKGTTLLDDISVPKHAVPAMCAKVQETSERHGLVIGSFGHAGDGNLHPTIVFDGQDPSSVALAHTAFDEILRDAVSLGGSITGEHGIGTLKRKFESRGFGATERALMARIKSAFDPNGILNPGKAL
jgi:D-lactate dehydrogenase (cytochrome)/glycolate oxidase